MKILSLTIKEGVFEKTFNFSKGVNLICSKQNSRGKTTLLRCLLYALGYSVPSTRGFFFDKCDIQIYLDVENYGVVSFIRNNKNSITAEVLNETRTFILPEEQVELHSFVFKTNNSSLIDNILGTFYIDQEKGWTLLNRGVVIGGIRFNIEDLIRGLSGKGCEKLLEQQQNLKSKLIIQVHDELVFDCLKVEQEEITNIMKNVMENICKLNVPLKIDIENGNNWYEAK